MTMLLEKLISDQEKASMFILNSYWLDIGRLSDFNKAQEDFEIMFRKDN